jgi:hypothetical protein
MVGSSLPINERKVDRLIVQLPYQGIFKSLAQAICLKKARDSMFLTVANSYMDESFDPKHQGQYRGFFCVGGMLGRGDFIYELEYRWNQLLKKHGLAYFKASQCENGWGEFAKFVPDPKNITLAERIILDLIGLEFIGLITNPVPLDATHYLTCYGVGLMQDDFYDVIKDSHAHAVLGDNPYRLAYDFSFIECSWLMKQLGEGWGAHFVCDEHEIYSPLAPEAYRNLKETNPQAAEYMLSFTSIDEKKCAPVQAADAVVYEIRRALNFQHKKHPDLAGGAVRKQFTALTAAHGMAYIAHTEKAQLEWIAANHQPGEPFKLDEIMNKQLGANIDKIGV